MLAHWDDVETWRADFGHLVSTWSDLGRAAGTRGVGVKRIQVDPGKWSTPAHVEAAEEEIFFVLGGSGLSWQDGSTYAVGPGDCIVHLAASEAHTLCAGDEGLDVLAFGTRVAEAGSYLPRAKVAWAAGAWVDAGHDPAPWHREVAAGEPAIPAQSGRPRQLVDEDEAEPGELDVSGPGPRPANIVNAEQLEGDFGGRAFSLGASAGSQRTGLNLVRLDAGETGAPPHCHSAEEELFVVLEGGATLELWPSPVKAQRGVEREQHELRAGHVVARPPGSGIAHAFRAGGDGFTYLAYGTREPNDIAYYPRSNKVYFRGVGLIARLEHLDYFDGEPDD